LRIGSPFQLFVGKIFEHALTFRCTAVGSVRPL
jgi:hypothetical protein